MTGPPLNIGIFIYDQVEVLDFAGPYEVFSTASRVKLKMVSGSEPPFNVFTVAESARLIRARGELGIHPDYDFDNHPQIGLLIVPGGVVEKVMNQEPVIRWISHVAQSAAITASVCTGAFLLAKAGLLEGKPVTTHWEDIQDLRSLFPSLDVITQTRWVDTSDVVSSAGISAGIDMSLHLVERLEDRTLAEMTARQMEFDWRNSGITV